jgi:hypothetical protein
MVDEIEAAFPRLRGGNYQVTSPPEDAYNCVAWAAGDPSQWWWPDDPCGYWPDDVPRMETVEAFRQAFATLGYVAAADDELQPDFEKIALFADDPGILKHVARQMPSGRWTSKIGLLEDIEHALHDLEGAAYGSITLVLKRPVPRG